MYEHLAKAAGKEQVSPGETINITVDLVLAHDGTGPKLLKALQEKSARIKAGNLLFTVDHAFPAPSAADRKFQKELSEFAKVQGCALYNHGEGVLHQVVAEKAAVSPGMILAGADGHVATAGAFGALAFALSPEETADVLESGQLALTVPECLTIELKGKASQKVLPRDVALSLIARLAGDLPGKAVALTGEFVRNLSLSGRMALCNLLPEAGVVTVFILPEGEEAGASAYSYDVSEFEPMVAVPPRTTAVKSVREVAGVKITVAIAGGCSAGRLEDMEEIAAVLRDNEVHPDVTFIITPASRKVANDMEELGFSRLFREKGAVLMPPGCGPCPGKHFGVLAAGDTAITTTIRNTPGRIGDPEAEIYLASPRIVAWAAVRGQIA